MRKIGQGRRLGYTVKKLFAVFPSIGGMSLTKLCLGGNSTYLCKQADKLRCVVWYIFQKILMPVSTGGVSRIFPVYLFIFIYEELKVIPEVRTNPWEANSECCGSV
jgi:hypothetical protein